MPQIYTVRKLYASCMTAGQYVRCLKSELFCVLFCVNYSINLARLNIIIMTA